MAKRFGNFNTNSTSNKKLKIDENLDDLWGDDLDADDVEDCFKLATQICEKDNIACSQRNNVSILPSYNGFKQQTSKRIFTSTQSNPNLNSSYFPSTSTNGLAINKKNGEAENGLKRTRSFESPKDSAHLESKIKKLQEQCVAKEGEVSILRSQLKDIRSRNENEQLKKQKELLDKLAAATKQINSIKSELDFKNLEIANLKQKVNEVGKLTNLDMTINASQSPFFKSKAHNGFRTTEATTSRASNASQSSPFKSVRDSIKLTEPVARTSASLDHQELKLHAVIQTAYPLQDAIAPSIFNPSKKEKYLVDIKSKHLCRNTIPFLLNQMSQDLTDKLIKLQPKVTMLNNERPLEFDYIYSNISELMKCRKNEIESEENHVHINKVLCVSEQLIQNLHQFLQEVEQNTQMENKEKMDVIYLKNNFDNIDLNRSPFDSRQWCENEMGIGARQSIMCISEILPYSTYLRRYLLQNKSLIFKGNEEYLKHLPSAQSKLNMDYSNNFDYLNLIIAVITSIKRLKKSHNFPGFLSAVARLLDQICQCFDLNPINNLMYKTAREIIYCNPNLEVLFHITKFLKDASRQSVFVNNLCKMPARNALQVKHKERVVYYNKDSTCVLQVLCVLLEDHLSKVKNEQIVKIYLNVMTFVSNCVEHNCRWLFDQEDKHCDCLSKIVKLYVDILYQTVQEFLKENKWTTPNKTLQAKILESGIRTLHFLNFKVSDLIIKYIATYTRYKIIIKLLRQTKSLNLSKEDVELLENLNVAEEVHSTKLSVPLWNK